MENAFVSCRLCLYIWFLRLRLCPQTSPGLYPWTPLREFPDSLCPPYLQTLATLLGLCFRYASCIAQ